MGLALSFLALAVAAATPAGDPRTWFGRGDLPIAPWDAGSTGISYRVTVSAAGVPVRCEFGHDNATKSFGTQICTSVMARAVFTPARGSDGAATVGTFDGNLHWQGVGKTRRGRRVPDLIDIELSVARLPGQIRSPAMVLIAYAVGSNGHISDCTPFVPSIRGGAEDIERRRIAELLGPTACRSALPLLKPRPALDADGRAIASIQTSRIKFTGGKASAD